MSDSILNNDDRIKFCELFRCYCDVFAFADEQLVKTSLVQHLIDTGDAMPIKQRPYRTSPRCKQEIVRQVDGMLQKGIRFSLEFTGCSRQEKKMVVFVFVSI